MRAFVVAVLALASFSVFAAPQGRGGGGAGAVTVPQVTANPQSGATGPTTPLVTTGIIVGRVLDAASGAPVAGVTVTLSGGPSRAQQATPPAPGAPAAGGRGPASSAPRMLTDGEGRFAFRGLTRGTYTIQANKNGYSPGAYGRNRPEGPTRSLTLDDNEHVSDAVVRIFKYATITGRITDEAGEPIVGARVVAYRRVLLAGRRRFRETSTAQTDDRGIYRLASLVPAEYVVAAPLSAITAPNGSYRGTEQNFAMSSMISYGAGPNMGSGGRQIGPDGRFLLQSDNTAMSVDSSGRARGYATQYYPAARALSSAEILPLASGEDRSGVDIQMRYVPVSTISGTLTVPSGLPANMMLRLIAADAGDMTFEPESAVTATDGNGAFMFACIPSGQYTIQAVRMSREPMSFAVFEPGRPDAASGTFSLVANGAPQQPSDPMLWATVPVTVGESDVTGVTVAMQEGFTITGRFEFTGTHPRPDAQRLQQIPVTVEAADARDNGISQGPPSRAGADGRFVTAPRTPGKYLVRVGGSPANYIVQSIVINGVNATDTPIDLTASVTNAVITFTDQIPSVTGTVRGVEPSDDPPLVVVYPADSRAWKDYGLNPLRVKSTRATGGGGFTFGSLVAGEYFAVSIPDEFSAEYSDPAYLELLSRGAERFMLTAGEKKTISIDVSKVRPPGAGRSPAAAELDCGIDCSSAVPQTLPSQARDTNVQPTGTGSISGTVTINDGATSSGRPARLARIVVSGPQLGSTGQRTAITDDAGRYAIGWLPAGNYMVTASKPAFVNSSYGAKRVGGVGTVVAVANGQAVGNIDISMPKGAVITGVVIDESGQPAAGVRVQLLAFTRREGERMLSSSGGQNNGGGGGIPQTNDRGEYRFYGLRPGKYVVMAQPAGGVTTGQELRQLSDSEMRAAIAEAAKSPTPQVLIDTLRPIAPAAQNDVPSVPAVGRSISYSPVYYPGTVLESEAGEVAVGAGDELTGINVQLRAVPASRLEGRVIGPDGQVTTTAQVQLVKISGTGTSSTSIQQRNGVFQATAVPAGRYFLTAQLNLNGRGGGAGTNSASSSWAQIDLSLNGDDHTDLILALAPLPSITGRITFEGGAPPNIGSIQVNVEPAAMDLANTVRSSRPASPDANGDFTITNVVPGRYRLNASAIVRPNEVTPLPPGTPPPSSALGLAAATGWSMASASIAGQDAFISPFEVRAGQSLTDAQVTMTNKPSEISGKLIDGGSKPVPNMTVVLFPVDRSSWPTNSSRLNRTSRASATGTFSFPLVVPGDYYLAVLTDLDNNDWQEVDFKEQIVPSAIKVTVAKGEKKVQDMIVGR